jgi:hypothetical protein
MRKIKVTITRDGELMSFNTAAEVVKELADFGYTGIIYETLHAPGTINYCAVIVSAYQGIHCEMLLMVLIQFGLTWEELEYPLPAVYSPEAPLLC